MTTSPIWDTHELAWAAGFFDGEGTTHGRVRTERPGKNGDTTTLHMKVAQVCREPLDRFHHAVRGLGKIYGPYNTRVLYGPTGKQYRCQPIWEWRISNWRDAQAAYTLLWKYLSPPKRAQVMGAVAIFRSNPQWGNRVGRQPQGGS